jgi:hypothetical protein
LGGDVKPTFLTISVNESGTYNLHWLFYDDVNHPTISTYYVYSGKTFPLTLKDSVAGTVQDYIVPTSNTDSIFAIGVILPCGHSSIRGIESSGGNVALSNHVDKKDATGIKNINANNQDIKIYPNPVKDIMNIQTELDVQKVEVDDVVGRNVLTTRSKIINFTGFSEGCYLIKVTTKLGTLIDKIVR